MRVVKNSKVSFPTGRGRANGKVVSVSDGTAVIETATGAKVTRKVANLSSPVAAEDRLDKAKDKAKAKAKAEEEKVEEEKVEEPDEDEEGYEDEYEDKADEAESEFAVAGEE